MRYCKIENNKVVDFIEATDSFIATQAGTYIQDDTAKKGWIYDGTSISEPIQQAKPTPTFEEQKQEKIKQLQAKYQAEYDAYLSQYPQREAASFPTKQAEAFAYIADNTSPTPIIDAILTGFPAPKDEYVASIIDKINYLAEQEGQMVAIRDSIKACTTQSELDAIEV